MTLHRACTLIVRRPEVDAIFDVQWYISEATTTSAKRLCRKVDLLLQRSSQSSHDAICLSTSAVERFISDCTESNLGGWSGPVNYDYVFSFIVPDEHGFVIRSDFLERRLDGFEFAYKVQGFLKPRQEVQKTPSTTRLSDGGLEATLDRAIGGVFLKPKPNVEAFQALKALDTELDNRLSYQWLCKEPIPTTRLVWVEGRPDFEISRRMYEAAWALGISLVVIDNPGHWLSIDDVEYSYLREAFIPVDISVDEGFVDRIVTAVRNYGKPVDGVMSVSDARGPGVAKVCEILGLPTSPHASYVVAADKYKTRMMELSTNGSFRVSSSAELLDRLQSRKYPDPQYPVMVKPCMGWGSESTSKVSTQSELVQAVAKASTRHEASPQQRTDVLIEPYVEGPEIDINVVLYNNEIAFFEVSDDFPKLGDTAFGGEWDTSFLETMSLVPSQLPEAEIVAAKQAVRDSIVRQGFSTGTFHCEGRIRYSSMHYTDENGVLDLRSSSSAQPSKPSFYLHEINARPAGYFMSVATLLTYGVDYYALQQLYSIGDHARFLALSRPFSNGAQWWLAMVIIPEPDYAGTMKTEDPGQEMLERVKELKHAVPHYKTVAKKGRKLLGSRASALSFLAYFHVVSRKSREDALRLAELVRQEFKYDLY